MSNIPSHVLALYDHAIIMCASQPHSKLEELFNEIKGLFPQYPMPYVEWRAKVAKRHDGNGVELSDAPGPYNKPGVKRPAIGREMVQMKKDAMVAEKRFNESKE